MDNFFMNMLIGILLIAWGLGLMAFGLWVFYAVLPVWYGMFGGLMGFFLGVWMTGGSTGWFGNLLTWGLAIAGALLFAFMAYQLEPYRRVLAGILMGFSLGSLVAVVFGGGAFFTAIFGGIGAVIFAVLVPLFFDPMIIVGSSFSGAALVMDGIYMIVPLGLFLDRTNAAGNGNFLAIVTWIVLGAVGLGWQLANLRKWVTAQVAVSGKSA
jgi:hypothetical protein